MADAPPAGAADAAAAHVVVAAGLHQCLSPMTVAAVDVTLSSMMPVAVTAVAGEPPALSTARLALSPSMSMLRQNCRVKQGEWMHLYLALHSV